MTYRILCLSQQHPVWWISTVRDPGSHGNCLFIFVLFKVVKSIESSRWWAIWRLNMSKPLIPAVQPRPYHHCFSECRPLRTEQMGWGLSSGHNGVVVGCCKAVYTVRIDHLRENNYQLFTLLMAPCQVICMVSYGRLWSIFLQHQSQVKSSHPHLLAVRWFAGRQRCRLREMVWPPTGVAGVLAQNSRKAQLESSHGWVKG